MKKNKKKYYIFSLDMKLLNVFSFLILFMMIGLTLILDKDFLVYSIDYAFELNRLLLTFILVVLYFMLHEILHSFGYYLYGAKYKNIIYGIELEKGIFYCLCKGNVNKKNIMNSLMFPLFYIGICTYIISFIIDSSYLLILSIFNISGCTGDIFTFLFMLKLDKDIEFSEFDDTTSFAIYTDKALVDCKCLGLKYIDVLDDIKREEYTKIRVSKWSYVIIVVIFLICMVSLFM